MTRPDDSTQWDAYVAAAPDGIELLVNPEPEPEPCPVRAYGLGGYPFACLRDQDHRGACRFV